MSANFILPKIYPITDQDISGSSHADQVLTLTNAGARFIQMRAKDISGNEFYNQALSALSVAKKLGAKLIINDRVDIALAVDAHGVHLGQDDLDPFEARKMLGSEKLIGYSTHSVEQAIAAATKPIDYIAIGPVYNTSTKTDHDPVVGLDGIAAVRSAIGSFPLVAIGGINESNLSAVLRAGANSAAIISSLFNSRRSIADNYLALIKAAS